MILGNTYYITFHERSVQWTSTEEWNFEEERSSIWDSTPYIRILQKEILSKELIVILGICKKVEKSKIHKFERLLLIITNSELTKNTVKCKLYFVNLKIWDL